MKKLITLAAAALLSASAFADIAVVVNKANTADVSKSNVQQLFLGRMTQFRDGTKATPVVSKPNHAEFSKKALKKSLNQTNLYWSRLVFTGKGQLPTEYNSDKDVINAVALDLNTIGFVDTKNVTDKVKVLFTYK